MSYLVRSFAIAGVAIRRLMSNRGLALATSLGLIASTALIMAVPLYSDAVYYRILQEELSKSSGNGAIKGSSFVFMFRYSGLLYGLKEWTDIEKVDAYLSGSAITELGLPRRNLIRYAKTDSFRLFAASDVAYADSNVPMNWVRYAFVTDFDKHIKLLEGRLPVATSANSDDAVEVAVSRHMAEELGMQVGEDFVTFREVKTESGGKRTIQIPARLIGIWDPIDPADEYWFYRIEVFNNQLFVPEATFQGRISSILPDEIGQFLWYWLIDGSNVRAADADQLAANIEGIVQQASSLHSNTRLEISPYDALRKYRLASRLLNISLYAYSIPIIALLLAFIGLVVGLNVSRQRNEIAVLRSRGATAAQIMMIAILEALVLGALALAIGIPTSEWVTQAIGATKSFLNFTLQSDLRVQITLSSLQFGAGALLVTLLAQVLPSLGASRNTIVSFKAEQARTTRPPWWQRSYLDLLLLIPAGYGTYILQQQGRIITPGAEAVSGTVFDNPLLFLVPTLGALALTLVVIRLIPLLMTFLALIAARTRSIGFLLAARYLARDPGFFTTPLMLLILTLSLSAFTATLAQTLDNDLFDQSYYKVGADAKLVEWGVNNEASAGSDGSRQTAEGAVKIPNEEYTVPVRDLVPVQEHMRVKEILGAIRVGDFAASIQAQGKWQEATLKGIDRLEFPKVSYWRRDFASANLGALMNLLALYPEGLLLERSYMRQNSIRVGDSLQVKVVNNGVMAELTMKVMGDFYYFPTWYSSQEEGRPLIVGNLEYIFETTGGESPFDVLVKLAPNVDTAKVLDDLREIDINVTDISIASQLIADSQRRPERQGLFGILSVGFLAAALLTVLGFQLYSLFSFRRRFIELGTLRAIGLSAGQMATFLAWELAILILLGLAAGTWLGALISNAFIPYLQVGTDIIATTPPYTVQIAWPAISRMYGLFILLYVVALGALVGLMLRMKIFQAIKLGETV